MYNAAKEISMKLWLRDAVESFCLRDAVQSQMDNFPRSMIKISRKRIDLSRERNITS